MCTPAAPLVMQGFGAATSALGAYGAARSQKIGLRGAADIADINANIAELAAQQTEEAGRREMGRVQMSTAQLKGRQRASLAANGVDLGEGSALQILTTTDVMGEIDANTVQANAVRAAWGQRIQGTSMSNDARMKRAQASAISPFGAAATSLLGSAGGVAKSWYEYDKNRATEWAGSTWPSGK